MLIARNGIDHLDPHGDGNEYLLASFCLLVSNDVSTKNQYGKRHDFEFEILESYRAFP